MTSACRCHLETAGYLLQRDLKRIIFLDGRPFSRRYQIDKVVNAATDLHQNWRILDMRLPRGNLVEDASNSNLPRAHILPEIAISSSIWK